MNMHSVHARSWISNCIQPPKEQSQLNFEQNDRNSLKRVERKTEQFINRRSSLYHQYLWNQLQIYCKLLEQENNLEYKPIS